MLRCTDCIRQANSIRSHGRLSGLKAISDACTYVPPLCISVVVEYAEDPSSASDLWIFLVATAMLLAPLAVAVCEVASSASAASASCRTLCV